MSRAMAIPTHADEAAHRRPSPTRPAAPAPRAEPAATPVSGMVLQRCACGGGCPACDSKASALPTLTINDPDDAYEREADRVADAVMAGGAASPAAAAFPAISQLQRAPSVGDGADVAPPIVHEVLASPGEPLDAGTRAFMEPRFGHDLSGVRVHTNSRAAEAAIATASRAFTVTDNIVFGPGEYVPHTESGRRLLSHELTHVVQQQAHADSSDLVTAGLTHSSATPRLRMQKAAATLQRQPDPNKTRFRTLFQKMMDDHDLVAKINGPLARQLAKAYVNRPESKPTEQELHTTSYFADRVKYGAALSRSEDDVYNALVGALDMTRLAKGNKVENWAWVPVPEKVGSDDALVEIGRFAVAEYLGGNDLSEVLVAQAKDYAFDIAIAWLEKRGMIAIAEIATGVGAVVGYFTLAFSTLELLILLSKAENPEMSKDEIIVSEVKAWLSRDQTAAKAAADAASAQKSLDEFYGVKPNPWAPVSTKIGP
jgi:hypothetical protein